MVVQEDVTSSSLSPRWEIPDIWAKSGHCPLCGAVSIQVVHLPDFPDYILCNRCELSFEVERNGCQIHVKNVPERLESYENKLSNGWIEPSTLSELLVKNQSLVHDAITAPTPNVLSEEELWNRVLSLYRLGNRPRMIQFQMIQSGVPREQAETMLGKLLQQSTQDLNKQNRKFIFMAGIPVFLFLMLVIGWGIITLTINSQLENGTKNSSSQSRQPNVPLQVLNTLPDWIKPGFLRSPDTRVDYSGPSVAGCPQTSSSAAMLFGGDAGSWKHDSQTNSWQMMNTGVSTVIRIPAGMYAGYISNQSFQFSTVNGPATIYDVNFTAIMCD